MTVITVNGLTEPGDLEICKNFASVSLTETKATWLASLRSGKTKYKSAVCSDHKVRLAGDTALVTGRATIEAEVNGQPRSLRLVFLNAWTKTPKGWKFIAWHSTLQPTT